MKRLIECDYEMWDPVVRSLTRNKCPCLELSEDLVSSCGAVLPPNKTPTSFLSFSDSNAQTAVSNSHLPAVEILKQNVLCCTTPFYFISQI